MAELDLTKDDPIISDSILTLTKKALGIEAEYTHFDPELIMFINNAFFTLQQLGVGPPDGFVITDETDSWDSFLEGHKDLEGVKTYVYLKTRLDFDPPQMGYLVDSINKQCDELVWRLNVQVDPGAN